MGFYKINKKHIENLSVNLKKILDEEIKSGNIIRETYVGDWPFKNSTMIFLDKPFITPININIPKIKYSLINDPHYWKAQYHDLENNTFLCCCFDGPNFDEL